MGDDSNFEDIIRAVGRRKSIVVLAVIVFAALGAAYGRLTTAQGDYAAAVVVNFVPTNAVLAESQSPPPELSASVEAVRIETALPVLADADKDLVDVEADSNAQAVIITAQGSTPAEATDLALEVANGWIAERRAAARARFTNDLAFQRTQLDAVTQQLDEVNKTLAELDTPSFLLEGQRIQLFDRLLRTSERVSALEINANAFDSGLSEPTLVDEPMATASSGWVVFGLLGGMLGAMIGIGIALLANSLDHRLRSRADVEKILSGSRVLGVLPRGELDTAELDEVLTRIRSAAGSNDVALITADGALLPAELVTSLAEGAGIKAVDRPGDIGSAHAVVAVRSGRTTDAELAAIVADLDVRQSPVVGVLLWDVSPRDLMWARRPMLTSWRGAAS